MHVYVTGDTHVPRDIHKFLIYEQSYKITQDDIFIVAGDFGLIWDRECSYREWCWTQWLDSRPFTTFFCDGNHENFHRLNKFEEVEMFGGKVGRVSKKVFHLKRGEIYTIKGKKFFTFGGAQSIDKHHRIPGVSHWDEELPTHAEINYGLDNLAKHGNEVDYIITHNAPRCVIEEHFKYPIYDKTKDPTLDFFNEIFYNTTFERWFFGHWHEDKECGSAVALFERTVKIL